MKSKKETKMNSKVIIRLTAPNGAFIEFTNNNDYFDFLDELVENEVSQEEIMAYKLTHY
jgi:hypothetical protein